MISNNWKAVGDKKRAGVLAPLFLFYSARSLGIGDFRDIKLLVDWCRESGNSILQLLPMNEVGSTCCPYDAVSSFALESSYISIEGIPAAKDKNIASSIAAVRKKFPAGKGRVDYRIKDEKLKLLRHIYESDPKASKSKGFAKFVSDNSYWIDDFALFRALKCHNSGKPWYEWDEPYRDRDGRAIKDFSSKHSGELDIEKWIQYIAFEQFTEAGTYASSRRVFIKGDLPILISRDSADVWAHPEYFKLDFAAGAPPDMYCAKGQRWGMPTYDWERISSDGYRYLKEKFKYAENFYDMLRIDHVVGLFRIWSIPYSDPQENEGLNGKFDPVDEGVWAEHGRSILSVMLKSSGMLLCAEDLGVVPKSCTEALKEFGMPGNEVQRWVKDWAVSHDFLSSKDYRKCAVSMLSTHDTTNWAAWWENEAGTVDEALFRRMCADNNRVNYDAVAPLLFDTVMSRHGRLRWLTIVSSNDVLVNILGRKREELKDFIELYENTYKEKEKLWACFGLKGEMREKSDAKIVEAAIKLVLNSRSIFAINLATDYLYLDDIFKGDPYKYRINRPGTVNKDNWSLTLPISLEDLIKNKVTKKIADLTAGSGRV